MKRVFLVYFWIIIALSAGIFEVFASEIVNNQRLIKEKDLSVDMIEFILKYRITLLKMLYGAQKKDGSFEGLYGYGDRTYGIYVLSASEKYAAQNGIAKEALTPTLVDANKDFIEKTVYFLTFAKKLNEYVFEEVFFKVICMEVFEKYKQPLSFQYLESLIVKVLFVLNKLIESSPKATMQCYERATKWQKIKVIIEEFQNDGLLNDSFDQINFLRFIKNSYLDLFLLGELTKDQVEVILQEYTSTNP